jgi:hypothetical protein
MGVVLDRLAVEVEQDVPLVAIAPNGLVRGAKLIEDMAASDARFLIKLAENVVAGSHERSGVARAARVHPGAGFPSQNCDDVTH